VKTTPCNLKETIGKVTLFVILAIFLSLSGHGLGEAADQTKHYKVSNKINSNNFQFCAIGVDVGQFSYAINKGESHTWDSTSCLKKIFGTCYYEWPGDPSSAKTVYLNDYVLPAPVCNSANYQVKWIGPTLESVAITND
jgi:hypothetical protein